MVKNKFKSIRTLWLILILLILNSIFCIVQATVRYVSHNGSNTPPYTSWATAADSIMFAINVSEFGDTIYVANGVYEEQVIMIPGLSLIGAGMDSCVIDTKLFAVTGYNSVEIYDECIIKGFMVDVSNNFVGTGITTYDNTGIIEDNKIVNAAHGIDYWSSGSISRNNVIKNVKSRGVLVTNFSSTPQVLIENNHFIMNQTTGRAIQITATDSSLTINNIILLENNFTHGFDDALSLKTKFFNNLIISKNNPDGDGVSHTGFPTISRNNFVIGEMDEGFVIQEANDVRNNVVIGADYGFVAGPTQYVFKYNNSWNNEVNFYGLTPDSTNLSVDPMIVNDDTTKGELDFHLQMFSLLIDAGDPNILDVDGSRSDIGLYGGPFGESYTYQDLAPKPPRNLSAIVDSEYITLSWNPNTEADFNSYNLFRETTSNFTTDSTTFILSLSDTFYTHLIPVGIDALYYKLTAADNQDNESGPSEELAVIITSVNDYPATVSDYRLYQNFPNPFNPSTKIAYKLKERGYVKLYVYEIKGELVSVLVNQTQDAGYYEVEFGPETRYQIPESGIRNLASGIYIYQIMIKNKNNIPIYTDMKKMIFLK
jgi:hypothetical protein